MTTWADQTNQAEDWEPEDLWLLYSGFWSDFGEWSDVASWRDGPLWQAGANQPEDWT